MILFFILVGLGIAVAIFGMFYSYRHVRGAEGRYIDRRIAKLGEEYHHGRKAKS